MRHFNLSLIVWAKLQDSVHKPQILKRNESRSGSNRGPSAHQPSALPLGHTGSHLAGWLMTDAILKRRTTFVVACLTWTQKDEIGYIRPSRRKKGQWLYPEKSTPKVRETESHFEERDKVLELEWRCWSACRKDGHYCH